MADTLKWNKRLWQVAPRIRFLYAALVDLSESKRTRGLICLALAVVTMGVYWRVFGFDFSNYDDPYYVTDNKVVKGGLTVHGIGWAFTHCYASNWHPLTWISHMADCQIFGLWAGGHHLENVLFHAANSIVLFLLLFRLTGAQWRSAVVAGLFALHPLHVESVAWIAERKDVLSTFFGLLSLLAYVRYVNQSKDQGSKSKVSYAWALVLFALSLLAKPMLVTLPFVMLLLDFWPLQRVENHGLRTFFTPLFRKLVRDKWPWFVLALGSSLMTLYAQKTGGSVMSATALPFSWRFVNAIEAYFWYVHKLVWPMNLAVFYPMEHLRPVLPFVGETLCLVLVSVAALVTIRHWPFLLIGWLWFLGTLVPVIGLVQVGGQSMADRYSYIPSIGIFLAAVWGCGELLNLSKAKIAVASAGAGAVLVLCALGTISQIQFWRDDVALFSHAAAVTHDNDLAFDNLGLALYGAGRNAEALQALQTALQINPNALNIHRNIGVVLAKEGKQDEALLQYEQNAQLDPNNADKQNFLGGELAARGKKEEALVHHSEAVRLNPKDAEYQNNLGAALAAVGKETDAMAHYAEAVSLEPDNPQYQNNYGTALARAGQSEGAIAHYLKAVRLDPKYAEAYSNLGAEYFALRQLDNAVESFERAIELDAKNSDAYNNLGNALAAGGKMEQSLTQYYKALQLNPTNAGIRINMSLALSKMGRREDAIAQLTEAVHEAPASVEARYELGRQLFFDGQPQAAFDEFTEVLRLKPDHATATFYLGLVCRKLGQEETALKHLEEAARLRPGWADPLNAEAWILATSENDRLRDGAKAVRLAEKAVQMTARRQPAVLNTLAAAYAEGGRFGEATANAKEALEMVEHSNQTNLVTTLKAALESYEANKPFRQKDAANN